MADLAGGKYPQNNPLMAFVGQGLTNAVTPGMPARSNAEWFGLSTMSDGALAGSGIACVVPVPVDPAMIVSKITIIVGATPASTPTHSFAALYSGIAVPALLGQSADALTGAIAASLPYTFTLATPQLITTNQAPNGFIYVAIAVTGTAVNTAASISTPAGINNGSAQWGANAPLFLSMTAGSALGATAAATVASPAAKAVAPIVFLT